MFMLAKQTPQLMGDFSNLSECKGYSFDDDFGHYFEFEH